MAYTRGSSANIIVGAAALFTYETGPIGKTNLGALTDAQANTDLPDLVDGTSYRSTLSAENSGFRNVGYTMNGLEIQFQPDFGEVQVDQVLDVAKLYKQGMQVNLNTTFAEATLENLLFALAGKDDDLGSSDSWAGAGNPVLRMSAGDIGECPVERGLVAVGPGTGDCEIGSELERIYVAYRALSIESVTVSAKRDEATMFEVSFRLLPNDDASYGKIVDRTVPAA
ncbi:MAG: hypothetical protein EBS31_00040 [Burkholderiaceae bacterium]|nr:hypothetical protein [Burkholderiaceae bacterium]